MKKHLIYGVVAWIAIRAKDPFARQSQEVQWADILAPHLQNTATRMAEHEGVLCIQNTTELDFNRQQALDLGPLSYEAQREIYLYPALRHLRLAEAAGPLGCLDVSTQAARQGRQSTRADGEHAVGRRV